MQKKGKSDDFLEIGIFFTHKKQTFRIV